MDFCSPLFWCTFQMAFFLENDPRSSKIKPKWSQNGGPILVSTIFLEPCFRATLHGFCLIFWFFASPTCPRNLFFFVVLLRPPKNNTNLIFLQILVSFWVPVRGGITHFCGLVSHHYHTECEFSKFTPTKHMVFEAISGASAHLGPPWSQNGPRAPPKEPQ